MYCPCLLSPDVENNAGPCSTNMHTLLVDYHMLEQAAAGLFARAAGRSFEMGLAQSRAEEWSVVLVHWQRQFDHGCVVGRLCLL